jgi:hypothetical protein
MEFGTRRKETSRLGTRRGDWCGPHSIALGAARAPAVVTTGVVCGVLVEVQHLIEGHHLILVIALLAPTEVPHQGAGLGLDIGCAASNRRIVLVERGESDLTMVAQIGQQRVRTLNHLLTAHYEFFRIVAEKQELSGVPKGNSVNKKRLSWGRFAVLIKEQGRSVKAKR